MNERVREPRSTEKILAPILKAMRPLVIIAGLVIAPAPAKAEGGALKPDEPVATYVDTGYETGFEWEDSYGFDAPPGLREFLEAHPQGRQLLQLESAIKEAVHKLRTNAENCKGEIDPSDVDDIRQAAETVKKLIGREIQFTNGINTLGYAPSREETPLPTPEAKPQSESGDSSGEMASAPFETIEFDKISQEAYISLAQEGSDTLGLLQTYLKLVEQDDDLKKALKWVFQRTGCLLY